MTDFTLGPGPLTPEFEQVKSDIGIVENGNTATHAIPAGYYVIWKGDLYVAKTDISSGTALSAESNGNLTAKTQGIGAEVAALNSNMKNRVFTFAESIILANSTNINTVNAIGCYTIQSIDSANTMTNLPIATAGVLYVKGAMNLRTSYIQQIFIPYTADAIYIRMSNNSGSSWFAWRVIGQEDGWWNIDIPRATFTTLANNRWHRQGNIVFCETCIEITESQSGNAYISSNCIPKFGFTLGNVQGVWHDYNMDMSGTIAGYNGGNIWMALNGNSPSPLTNHVGHAMGITLTAMLH